MGTAVGGMVGIAVGIGAYDYIKYEGLKGKTASEAIGDIGRDLASKDARKEEKKDDSKTPDHIQNPTPISPPGSSGGAGSGWGTWTPPSSGGFGVTNDFIANANPNNVNVFRQTFDSTWKNAVTNSYEKGQTISAMQDSSYLVRNSFAMSYSLGKPYYKGGLNSWNSNNYPFGGMGVSVNQVFYNEVWGG